MRIFPDRKQKEVGEKPTSIAVGMKWRKHRSEKKVRAEANTRGWGVYEHLASWFMVLRGAYFTGMFL